MTDRDRGRDDKAGPSTGTGSPDAVEGSILEGQQSRRGMTDADRANTGAGAEAAEGIHSTRPRNSRDKSGVDQARDTARAEGEDRAGSEPLDHRDVEHKSGYGGEMSEPKTSSDGR